MPTKLSSIKGAIYGALVADAFALGAHWINDVTLIKEKFGSYDHFFDPLSPYHEGKKAGEFTNYGDQAMWLLESVSLEKEFSLATFSSRWKEYMSDYKGYIDEASKRTLENLTSGKSALESGSSFHDIGALGRMAGLAFVYADEKKALVDAAFLQTKMTHNTPLVLDAARFFSRLLFHVLQGDSPVKSAKILLLEVENSLLEKWVKTALASVDHESIKAIASFGQSAHINAALQGVLHLIFKYENDYTEAMRQNVYAGGDCAARGILVGMVLGGFNGIEAIPQAWLDSLSSKNRISIYLGEEI